jgi:peptide deformylase
MSILKVARMGHPVLRERARPITPADLRHPLTQKLIDDMIETMHEYHGVGLAAPQIHEGVRLFVALLDDEPDRDSEAIAVINPEITANSEVTEEASAFPTSAEWFPDSATSPSGHSTATARRSS